MFTVSPTQVNNLVFSQVCWFSLEFQTLFPLKVKSWLCHYCEVLAKLSH